MYCTFDSSSEIDPVIRLSRILQWLNPKSSNSQQKIILELCISCFLASETNHKSYISLSTATAPLIVSEFFLSLHDSNCFLNSLERLRNRWWGVGSFLIFSSSYIISTEDYLSIEYFTARNYQYQKHFTKHFTFSRHSASLVALRRRSSSINSSLHMPFSRFKSPH